MLYAVEYPWLLHVEVANRSMEKEADCTSRLPRPHGGAARMRGSDSGGWQRLSFVTDSDMLRTLTGSYHTIGDALQGYLSTCTVLIA